MIVAGLVAVVVVALVLVALVVLVMVLVLMVEVVMVFEVRVMNRGGFLLKDAFRCRRRKGIDARDC